jgi:hypothetical protein
MLRTLSELIRPPRLTDLGSFRTFVEGEAALIAQKTAVSYCRAKTLTFSHALFAEKRFQDALTVCRFEAFAAVLADLLIVADGMLRDHADRDRLAAALRRLYGNILAAQPTPEHRREGWADVERLFAERLDASRHAEPGDAAAIARSSAKRLYEVLPIHTNYRQIDEELITASVTFQMVALREKLQRALDAPTMARALAA